MRERTFVPTHDITCENPFDWNPATDYVYQGRRRALGQQHPMAALVHEARKRRPTQQQRQARRAAAV